MIWELFWIWMILQLPMGIVVGHFLHGTSDEDEFDDFGPPTKQADRSPAYA